MYNSGNSSKNVTGASVVDGTLENADYADNAISGDKIDGGTISNFTSTGIDDNATSTSITIDASENVSVDGEVTCTNLVSIAGTDTGNPVNAVVDSMRVSGYGIQANRGAMFLTNAATDGLIHIGNSGAHNSNILASFTSNGLTFNGDTAAANALDDYEEGTWTPTQTVVGAVGSVISANYRKIGSLVYFQFDIIAATTADTGQFQVVLPFAPVAFSTIQQFACSLAYTTSGANVAEVKGGTGVMLRTSHGGGNMTNATASGTRVIVSGSYIAA
jgi:hypothetical protein